jgi:hypothetical protein
VVTRPPDLSQGLQGEARFREQLRARTAALQDPRERVLVEAPLPELAPPLPRGALHFALEELPATPHYTIERGVVFSAQLRVQLELERPGLLVVVTYFAAEEPVHRLGGDIGRFCRQVAATIDGAPAAVHPVFYHCAGIVVPAGRHEVLVRQRAPGSSFSTPGGP